MVTKSKYECNLNERCEYLNSTNHEEVRVFYKKSKHSKQTLI